MAPKVALPKESELDTLKVADLKEYCKKLGVKVFRIAHLSVLQHYIFMLLLLLSCHIT